jgi:ATP-binding cassette, subfamily B, bacterial MsbA
MKSTTNSDKNIFEALRRIFSYAWPYRIRLLFALLASILGTLLWLAIPLGLRELIDAVFEQGDRQLLNFLTLGLIVLFVVQTVLGFAGSYILDWTGERIITDLRMNLYRHLHRLGLRFYSGQRSWGNHIPTD